MPRTLIATLCLVAVVAMVACGDASEDPTGSGDDQVEPRAADIVVQAYTTGAMGDAGTGVPAFEMRTDGTVYLDGGGPFGIDRYRLTQEGIDTVRDLVAGVEPEVAYGTVDWTDDSTTTVYLDLGDGPTSIEIYGLYSTERNDDLVAGHLTTEQLDARLALLGVLSELERLDERDSLLGEPRQPYIPTSIQLSFQTPQIQADEDPIESGEDPSDPADGPTAAWPLTTPLADQTLGWEAGQLCLTLEGADAAAVATSVEAPGVQRLPWTTGALPGSRAPSTVEVDVLGLLPGDDGSCEIGADPGQLYVYPLAPLTLADPSAWPGNLPADRFEPATALEAYAAAPVVAAGVEAYKAALPEPPYSCGPWDAEFDYPEGTCHVDGELRKVPETLLVPTGNDLGAYEYQMVTAEVDGVRHLDLEAQLIGGMGGPAWEPRPQSWRARIDLAEGTLVTVEVD